MSGQRQAEYQRHLFTDQALLAHQAGLREMGVIFQWERIGPRLIGMFRGADQIEHSGNRHQGAGNVGRLLVASFPHAVIEKGGQNPNTGAWWMVVWLDAPEGEARRREEQHAHLDPRPSDDPEGHRCPHDGALCRGKPSALWGVPPTWCEPQDCRRAQEGKSLVSAHPGYPLPGFVYPAKATK